MTGLGPAWVRASWAFGAGPNLAWSLYGLSGPALCAIIQAVDREDYVRAARTIRDSNNTRATIGGRVAILMVLPIGGGRRILKYVSAMVRRTETQLRALEPPPEDRDAIEEHFLRPWSELADYLEGLTNAPGTWWLSVKGAFRLLESGPQDRQEDIDFCVAYGLDDSAEQAPGSFIEQMPGHRDNGKA